MAFYNKTRTTQLKYHYEVFESKTAKQQGHRAPNILNTLVHATCISQNNTITAF